MSALDPDNPNAASLFEDALVLYPDRVALIDGKTGDSITYQKLDSLVASAGNTLIDLGIERKDRVALCFQNELLYLSAFFGAMRLGAVPVPVNVEVSDDTFTYIVDDCGAEVVVTTDESPVCDTVLDVAARVDAVHTCAVTATNPGYGEIDVDVVSFTDAMANASDELEPVAVNPANPALHSYTSGSTGRPKGVVLDHGGVAWNVDVIQKVHFFDVHDRGIVAAPLYHKNAMIGAIKPLLCAGGSIVIMDSFESTAVIEAIDEYNVTYLRGVPAMYKLLIDDDALCDHDVSSVEWAVSGSASLPAALVDEFEAVFDAPMGEAYGLTEGGPVVTLSPRWGPRKIGSSGLALPGVDTLVVDPDTGEELHSGETGELLVASPGLGRYYERPDAESDAFEEREGTRVLHTEDLVRIDEQGYHSVVGRLDDMLTVGGTNVYPAEVESLLQQHDLVVDVAVVGVPHEIKRKAPVAFVVVGGDITETQLKEFALEHGPNYAHPRRVFQKSELPLASTGKVDRTELEAEARERVGGAIS